MKSSLYLIILIFLTSCILNKKMVLGDRVNVSFEYGKIYYSLKEDDSSNYEKSGFIIEVVPAKLEYQKVHYPIEYFERYTNDYFRLLIADEYGRFEFYDKKPSRLYFTSAKESYWFAWVKESAQYKTFTTEELTEDGITIKHLKVKTKSHLIIENVKKQPQQLKENQYYYENGNWTEITEYIAPHIRTTGIMEQVQKKLKELGYDLEIDNKLDDEKTKEALIDYQKKNGLRTNGLNAATLKKLGL